MAYVDSDDCSIEEGLTTWTPWRWSHSSMGLGRSKTMIAASKQCRLRNRVRMRNPEDNQQLSAIHELGFELNDPPGGEGWRENAEWVSRLKAATVK